jgi:DNA-binding transcriptional ArsR family regulator
MRPLVHPSVEEISVEGILYALSDPVRVRIFADLVESACAQSCTALAQLNATPTPMPKSTLSQHFKILREAGLIRSERKGVELQNRTRWDEIGKKFGPMIGAIIEAYAKELTARGRSARR